jgi:hypothetical protein
MVRRSRHLGSWLTWLLRGSAVCTGSAAVRTQGQQVRHTLPCQSTCCPPDRPSFARARWGEQRPGGGGRRTCQTRNPRGIAHEGVCIYLVGEVPFFFLAACHIQRLPTWWWYFATAAWQREKGCGGREHRSVASRRARWGVCVWVSLFFWRLYFFVRNVHVSHVRDFPRTK